jgi:twitching motility protein PilJ
MKRRSGKSEGSRKSIWFLSILLGGSLVGSVFVFLNVSRVETNEKEYLARAAEQRVVSEKIAKFALSAAAGDEQSFGQLRQARDQLEGLISQLKKGDPAIALPPVPLEVMDPVRALEDAWLELRQVADDVLTSKDAITTVRQYANVVSESVPKLQDLSQEVLQILVDAKSANEQITYAAQLPMMAQRIDKNVGRVLAGGQATAAAIDRFSRDADTFGRILRAMQEGSPALNMQPVTLSAAVSKLQSMVSVFRTINDHAEQIIETTPELLPALEAASMVTSVSDRVGIAASELIKAFEGQPGQFRLAGVRAGYGLIGALGTIAVATFGFLIWMLLRAARRREEESKEQNERNQRAILRLLDEMCDLADGDLTVTATVTEDVTGAIADSINYAIEALRNLVTTINETADMVSSSSQESRATAMHLAEASEHQAEQITLATEAIKKMAHAMDQMAEDAQQSADVARRSLEIAGKGAEAVRRTIGGMDTIRQQIQETSKRIKRLGESSQEIGDIVEIIDDIADQTNILALNAAMQAAMAGDAGRGFAVVADEVQRLAERSSNATKQIDALVKTIQADTNEAVSSMETTTAEVVAGARLAEDAGVALREIEEVSIRIAEVTDIIARSATQQSEEATKIDDTVSVIQEITAQTLEGTNQTASAIGRLADLAEDLQKSVAGFRLPA